MKQFKTYQEQLEILKSRGLTIADESLAAHRLAHHNYYRLSAYRFSLEAARDQFRSGSTFEDLWSLYCFDRDFRRLINEACKCIEISVRTQWAHNLGRIHGPMAYERYDIVRDQGKHVQNLSTIDEEIRRSREIFIGHY